MTDHPTNGSQQIRYADFLKIIEASKSQIFKRLFARFSEHFSIKKAHIAEKNLAKIFTATFRLANEVGFQSMSLRALAKETGMSMGGLYAYIQSKEQLAHLIYAYLNDYCLWAFQLLEDETQDAKSRLQKFIAIHIYLSELLQPWFYFAYMETKNLSRQQVKIAVQSELSSEQKILDILKQGVSEGVFHSHKINLIASLLKAMLQDWYLKRRKYQNQQINVDTFAEDIFELTCQLLETNYNEKT